MIFIIIEHFDFMILIQSMALSKTRVVSISKITVTSHTTNKLKTHFLRKFNDFFQIMNWIILKKSTKKIQFFPLFFSFKKKIFSTKKCFFSHKKWNSRSEFVFQIVENWWSKWKIFHKKSWKSRSFSSFQNHILKGIYEFFQIFFQSNLC